MDGKYLPVDKTARLITHNAEQTLAVGAVLGACLPLPALVCLNGDLGTGKTALAQGIARGIGVTCPVNSPSFTLMNLYDLGDKRFYHLDAYRLADQQEAMQIGLTDCLADRDAVTLIEWSDNIAGILPTQCVRIRLAYDQREDCRTLTLCCPADPALYTLLTRALHEGQTGGQYEFIDA